MSRFYISCFFFLAVLLGVAIGWAHTVGVETSDGAINLAGYGLPLILAVILGIIYKVCPSIPDRYKALIAIIVGISLGLIVILYEGVEWNIKTVIDGILSGLMTGAASIGLYEVSRTKTNPRS